MPTLTIIAGANGSGKTTFARPFVERKQLQFLNADDLAKVYEDKGMPNAMMKGGREFFKLLNAALSKLEDVVIETTLSGTYTAKVVDKARELGYSVNMIYIFLGDADTCVERVGIRVRKGGHHVPIEDVKRRYYRSITNFRNNYTQLADVWVLYYNGRSGFQLVAGYNDQVSVTNEPLYNVFKNIKQDD